MSLANLFPLKTVQGEEIQDVYSGTFLKSSQEVRAEVHARYNFSCRCRACLAEWPTEQFLVSLSSQVRIVSLPSDLCLQPRNVNRTHLEDRPGLSDKQVKYLDKTFKKVGKFPTTEISVVLPGYRATEKKLNYKPRYAEGTD